MGASSYNYSGGLSPCSRTGKPAMSLASGLSMSKTHRTVSLAVSMINDTIPPHQLVAAAAGIMFVYGVGSVTGPIAVSVLMAVIGPVGYFWGLAWFFLPLVLYAFGRIVFTTRPKQRRFINLPYRSSTAAAMLAEPSEEE